MSTGSRWCAVNREEGPAYGAALLAAVGVKAFADVATGLQEDAEAAPPENFDKKTHAAYKAPYERFRALYPALASVTRAGRA